MTKQQAIEILLKNKRMKTTLKRLIKWDVNKTLVDNANACKFKNRTAAYIFANRYNLDFIHIAQWAKREQDLKLMEEYRKLWDSKKGIEENAKALGVALSYARHLVRKLDVSYVRKYNGKPTGSIVSRSQDLTLLKMKNLKKMGFTYEEIGQFVGLSKQRVHQLI